MRYALSLIAVSAYAYWLWRQFSTPPRHDFNPDAMSDTWMNQRGYR